MNRVLFKSLSTEWATPKGVYEALDAEFHFNLDPCPLGGDVDGLATLFTSWEGRRVFINPPYDDIARWLARAPEAELAVYLIPARTDTRWFHRLILPHAKEIRFIKGRLTFGEAKAPAPFPSCVVVFGNTEPLARTTDSERDAVSSAFTGGTATATVAELRTTQKD